MTNQYPVYMNDKESHTCFKVMAGFQPSSSFNIDKQTVPEGYTLGWKRGGVNLPTKRDHSINTCTRLEDCLYIWEACLDILVHKVS